MDAEEHWVFWGRFGLRDVDGLLGWRDDCRRAHQFTKIKGPFSQGNLHEWKCVKSMDHQLQTSVLTCVLKDMQYLTFTVCIQYIYTVYSIPVVSWWESHLKDFNLEHEIAAKNLCNWQRQRQPLNWRIIFKIVRSMSFGLMSYSLSHQIENIRVKNKACEYCSINFSPFKRI